MKTTFKEIWWLNPAYIYLCLLLLVFYAWSISGSTYMMMYNVPNKSINVFYVSLYVICALLFHFGVKHAKPLAKVELRKCVYLRGTYSVLLVLCILAYIIWFANFVSIHGANALFLFLVPTELSSQVDIFHKETGHIAGLTSMTELGVVVSPLSMLLYKYTKERKYRTHLIIIFALSIVRALLFSERLAFLEIFVPTACVYIADRKQTKLLRLIPIYGICFILVIFGAFEYVRSWSKFYVNVYDGTFPQFIVDRLLGYYSVAINTECTYLTYYDPYYFPSLMLGWLWKLPLFSSVPSLFGIKGDYGEILETYANPEFNNPGGMLVCFTDFGGIGLFFFYIFGRLAGSAYKSYRSGSLSGYILYPVFLLCVLEMPRYFYFGGNRAFYVIIAMLIVYKKVNSLKY